jgi:transmembrane sensor
MSDPRRELDEALQQVAPHWDEARTERTLPGARHKRVARRRRAWLAASAGAGVVVLAALALLRPDALQGSRAQHASAAAERAVSFEDGSRALLLDTTARVVVSAVSRSAVDVSLPEGRARFDVTKRPERAFRVHCGAVVVEVLGTSFELTRAGERTRVSVVHGRVAVRWPGGATVLGAGESGWYPALPERAQTRAEQEPPAAEAEAAAARAEPNAAKVSSRAESAANGPPRQPAAANWRQHAEQGDFGRAYALLDATRVTDDVEELLLAADAARLSGHAAQAVPFLQRVSERHTDDPRAPLAAFTLGGVLMNQLGRPREAEAAYARARSLAPEGSLAQDALARQVEAAHRADDASRARTLALEYLARYPDGRRAQAVRRFGDLP